MRRGVQRDFPSLPFLFIQCDVTSSGWVCEGRLAVDWPPALAKGTPFGEQSGRRIQSTFDYVSV